MHTRMVTSMLGAHNSVPSLLDNEPWHVHIENVSPAAQFVWLCGGDLTLATAHRLRNLAAGFSADQWGQVVHIAETEGMSALVFHQATQMNGLSAAPSVTTAALADSYRQMLVTNSSLLRAQQAALAILSSNGIQAIPLKGSSLAVRLYGHIGLGLRPISDIDLLVQRRDIHRLDKLLRREGYHLMSGRASWMGYAMLLHADLGYRTPRDAKIEVHWELTHQPVYRMGLRTSIAWTRTRTIDLMGNPVLCLDVSDELRFLCLHCTVDHRLARNHAVDPTHIRLIWLVDIAQLIRSLPSTWDWPTFVRETITLGLATPVLVALAHCRAYLELDMPPHVMDALHEAALTITERHAWTISQGGIVTSANIRAHLATIQSMRQLASFAKGAIIPDPDWIRLRHGRLDSQGLSLVRAYAKYYLHVLKLFPKLFS